MQTIREDEGESHSRCHKIITRSEGSKYTLEMKAIRADEQAAK